MKVEFNTAIATIEKSEINLFKEMGVILNNSKSTDFYQACETHQKYVEFNSNITSSKTRCEISDLLLIAYSRSRKKIRITFLQAKFNRKKWDKGKKRFRFNSSVRQYNLLSERFKIHHSNAHNLPKDILASCSPSIGSFGIFYYPKYPEVSEINFTYCVANQLEKYSNISKENIQKNRAKGFYINMDKEGEKDGDELLVTFDMDTFHSAFTNLEIGALIDNSNDSVLNYLINLTEFFLRQIPSRDNTKDFIKYAKSAIGNNYKDLNIGHCPFHLIITDCDKKNTNL